MASNGLSIKVGNDRSLARSAREEQILDTLEGIFLAEGYRRVTIGELAARLRCSRQTLYRLAPSKQELFVLVLGRLLARVRRLGEDAAARQRNLKDQLLAFIAPGVSELRRASRLFSADVAALPAATRMLEHHQQTRRAQIGGLLEEGVRTGVFRRLHTGMVAEVILVAVRKVMDPEFLSRANLSISDAIAEVEDLMLRGLLHPDGST